MTTPRNDVAAVVVSWNPDVDRLRVVIDALQAEVSALVVVDNGSRNVGDVRELLKEREGTDLVELVENQGVSAALNIGVGQLRSAQPAWILTMDQDSVVDEGALARILDSYDRLDPATQARCGILALRAYAGPWRLPLTKYTDGLMVVGDRGDFTERRGVITSGNLVRAELFDRIRFDESLFVDQVDFDFCYSVRRSGYLVLEHKAFLMNHVLGERPTEAKRQHPYENVQRIYYIARNSTRLLLRGRLPIRFYILQTILFGGAYVSVNGLWSGGRFSVAFVRGVSDALRGRMGRREYPTKGRS